MNEIVSLSIGLAGMCCILVAFILVQRHRLSADDFLYDALNAVGSVLLVINAIMTHAWPFLVLNSIWGLYALRDVVRSLIKKPQQSARKDLTSPLLHKHGTLVGKDD